ncbi:Transcription factor spt20 [Coemansia interrupta]|uniref:Transcription factor spt20 n=1 Tax=Coemansia interrupta TaxID=1126814 RepID=A0A9W8LIK2_9FUNG|nr:Transcription factor spt20 [Coemansia interrupta]
MSASVVTGASVKPHSAKRDTTPHMSDHRSPSSAMPEDDRDSIIDFEDELQQELENEIDASFDSLFAEDLDLDIDFADDAEPSRLSAAPDRTSTEYSVDDDFGDLDHLDNDNDDDDDDANDQDEEDDDEVDFDFDDPSIPIASDAAAPTNPRASAAAAYKPPVYTPTNGSHPRVIEDEDDDEDEEDEYRYDDDDDEEDVEQSDSASEDEFEAVDFGSQVGYGSPTIPAASAAAASGTATATEEPVSATAKRPRTQVRIGDMDFLDRYKDHAPSLTLHLFDSHFRFNGQEGVFLYNSTMRFFFDALNEGRIPVDLVDVLAQVEIKYYEGCLIVEVHDHRRPSLEPKVKKQRVSELMTCSAFGAAHTVPVAASSPFSVPAHVVPEPGSSSAAPTQNGIQGSAEKESAAAEPSSASDRTTVYKKVMRPTAETLNLDIQLLCESSRAQLSQTDVLEIEGMVLVATEEPLDLEPDFQVSRISNAIRYIEYSHMLPRKRCKYNSAEIEAEKEERREKQKLLSLMDDRKNREFQPSFNRLSQVHELRNKKFLSDAEPHPEAMPGTSSTAGSTAGRKKNRGQMSLMPDGSRVIRTLRFVRTINNQSTHTVFHVLAQPEGRGLQGVIRWGVHPDTSIKGGMKTFSFPSEEIMRMHIDNFKLLLSIENNRLVYDSIYPDGIPTAGPPPSSSTAAASATPSTSSRQLPPVSTAGSTVVVDSAENSPIIESSVSSPVVGSNGVSAAAEVPGSPGEGSSASTIQTGSVAKNSARGSRKNSPQPKGKKAASASVEPEAEASTSKTKTAGQKGKSKKALAAAAAAAAAAAEKEAQDAETDGAAAAETDSADVPEIADDAEQQTGESVAMAASKSKGKQAAKASGSLEDVDEDAAKPSTSKEKKGAKGARKTPVPKERKPRAKSKAALAKAAAAEAAAAAAAAAASESSPAPADSTAKSQSPAASQLSVAASGVAGSTSGSAAEDDKPNVQSSALVSPAMTVNSADLLMSPQPTPGVLSGVLSGMRPPAMQQQQQLNGNISQRTINIAVAQLNTQLQAIARANGTAPIEIPTNITSEYLNANPQYYQMLRQQVSVVARQQLQLQLQQQRQQQQQQGGLSTVAGSIGSPQMRPTTPANMAAMMQALQNNTAAAVVSPTGSAQAQVQAPASATTQPDATSAGANSGANTGAQQPLQIQQMLNQLQVTREDFVLVQQYCRISGLQLAGPQDPRFHILLGKAKSGELRRLVVERPGMPAQQQPSNTAGQDMSSAAPMQANSISIAQTPAVVPIQLPRDLSTMTPQERQQFNEFMRLRQLPNAGAGQQNSSANPGLIPNQATFAAAANMLQQQRQMAMSAAATATAASAAVGQSPAIAGNLQSPMVRPAQINGTPVAQPAQRPQAPSIAAMASPNPGPAVPPGLPSAGQQQLLQQLNMAGVTPQERQQVFLQIQQMTLQQQQQRQQQQQQLQQAAAAAPQRPPQINIPMLLQQITSGQVNPAALPPQFLIYLLQNAQLPISPEHRLIMQQTLAHHIQLQQQQQQNGGNQVAAAAATGSGQTGGPSQ